MIFINFIVALILLSVVVYTFFLLLLGLRKMLDIVTNNFNEKSKSKGVSYYIKFFFVDNVNKNISQASLVIGSVSIALLILVVVLITK